MRIEPTLDEVINGKRGMLRGIEVTLKAQCLVSAVGLIFSTIDSLAALDRPLNKKRTDRHAFYGWVEKYLRPQDTLNCTVIDLYSARCGVLHSYSAESDLVNKGEAKQLIYKWRTGPQADADLPLPQGSIVIEIEKLHSALLQGIKEFIIDTEMDTDTKERVTAHLPFLLCYTPWPTLRTIIAA